VELHPCNALSEDRWSDKELTIQALLSQKATLVHALGDVSMSGRGSLVHGDAHDTFKGKLETRNTFRHDVALGVQYSFESPCAE
jgi:hypothetical protein